MISDKELAQFASDLDNFLKHNSDYTKTVRFTGRNVESLRHYFINNYKIFSGIIIADFPGWNASSDIEISCISEAYDFFGIPSSTDSKLVRL